MIQGIVWAGDNAFQKNNNLNSIERCSIKNVEVPEEDKS